jgi:predicted nucleic acid-binding protein
MNLVDSCGWLEYFAEGPQAGAYAKAIENMAQLVVPTVCMYEVYRILLRQVGRSGALEAFAAMRKATVVPLTEALSLAAASLGEAEKLPMADSIILATARMHRATLWTQDAHFRGMDGVRYIAKE